MDPVFTGDLAWNVVRTRRDGTTCIVRPLLPADRETLLRAFHEASAQTRYLRFGLATSSLTEDALTYLTEVDQRDHVAIGAVQGTRGIGVARFVRSKKDPSCAEAAVAVVDDMQKKGVGRALTTELARAALARGITRLHADVLDANVTMRVALQKLGAKPIPAETGDGLRAYELDLTAAATTRDADQHGA